MYTCFLTSKQSQSIGRIIYNNKFNCQMKIQEYNNLHRPLQSYVIRNFNQFCDQWCLLIQSQIFLDLLFPHHDQTINCVYKRKPTSQLPCTLKTPDSELTLTLDPIRPDSCLDQSDPHSGSSRCIQSAQYKAIQLIRQVGGAPYLLIIRLQCQ